MKIKNLLTSLSLGLALFAQAQIHPGSLSSWPMFYNAPANHTKEVWTIMGYAYYTVDITRDANNYVTGITTATQLPFTADQYTCIGSKTGNVYTATTKKNHNAGAFKDWRRDTWQSDGTNDTLIMWDDYDTISSTWKNVSTNSMTYSAGLLQMSIGRTWNTSTSSWLNSAKNVVTYVSGKKDKINNFKWDIPTSAWVDGGYIQYFYTGNKLDSMQEWNKDLVTSITSLKSRYIITSDVNNKTASFAQWTWKSSTSVWEVGISISFTGGSTGINEAKESEMISVYPIPANNELTIDLNNYKLKNAIVKIISMEGKEVYSNVITEEKSTIATTHLNNGIYFLLLESNGVQIRRQKLMIAH